MCALLYGIVADWKPGWLQRIWWATLGIFIAGLTVYIAALLLTGTTGLHIGAPELVLRITAPLFIGGVSLLSLFSAIQNEPAHAKNGA
jgi:hypothetical protein